MGIRLGIVGMVAALAGVGCTPDASRREPPRTQTPRPEVAVAQVVWRRPLDLVGEPVVSGGTAVVIVQARGDELDIMAIEAATGKVRWRAPYGPGDVSPGYGIAPFVTVDDAGRHHVMFQRPPRNLSSGADFAAPVVGVALRTGREVYRTAPRVLFAPLDVCSDGTDACAFLPAPGGVMSRFDLDGVNLRFRGRDIPMGDNEGRPAGAEDIGGEGLYTTEDGARIGRVRGGRRLWERPTTQLFGPGRTTELGWAINTDSPQGRYTGFVGSYWTRRQADDYDAGRVVTLSLDRYQLVSFRSVDGRVVWRRPAAHACAGRTDVRCRILGTSTSQRGRPDRFRVQSAHLEGVSRSGEVTWRVRMSQASAVRYLARDVWIRSEAGTAILDTPTGPRSVDLTDGSVTPVADSRQFLCEAERTIFQYAVPWDGSFTRTGGRLLQPCDATGRRARGRLTVEAVEHGGVAAGDGRRLVATPRGLVAYDVTG